MHWVIQNILGNEDKFVSLIQNIEKFGDKVSLVKVIPFVGHIQPDLDLEGKVICFGAYSMRKLSARKGWFPGVYDIDGFAYDNLIACLGKDVLNYGAVFAKFKDLKAPSDEFFIRPTHDGKEFAGCVKSASMLKEWQVKVRALGNDDMPSSAYVISLNGDTEVMAAPIKKIFEERRYFVVGDKVITGSLYKRGKTVFYGETDELIDVAQVFANKLVGKVNMPYVLDIALTEEGFKVIELNTLNCAGFYAADMQKLVHALIEYEDR